MKPKDWWKNMVIEDKEQNKKEFLATFCASRKSGQTKALQWVITDEMLFHEVVGFVVFDSPPRRTSCLWVRTELLRAKTCLRFVNISVPKHVPFLVKDAQSSVAGPCANKGPSQHPLGRLVDL